MRLLILAAVLAFASVAAGGAKATELASRLQKLANGGNAEASYHLGMIYNNGIGVEQDPERAFQYFSRAAAAGDPLGAYKVGCYRAGQFGDVVALDEAEALRFKLIAARAGYALAQNDVALIYLRQKDYRAALPWLEAASRQGNAHALYNLSAIYKDGLGTEPSLAKTWALFHLSQLAGKGAVNETAQASLDDIWRTMDAAQRKEAMQLVRDWISGSTPLTRLALTGLERAEMLASSVK